MSENARSPARIVIRVPNWVGDAVMATPALRSMRLGFPGSEIALFGKPKILELLQGLPSFDQAIPRGGPGRAPSLLGDAALLRRQRFDMGLLLPNSFSSALAFVFGRVRRRIGYAINGRGFLLSSGLPMSAQGRKRAPTPMTEYYLRIARHAGGAATGEEVELAATPEADARAAAFLAEAGLDAVRPLVGLNAGSSFGPSKCWSTAGFAAVAGRTAVQLRGRALLLCGPGEEAIAEQVVAGAGGALGNESRRVLPLDVLKSVVKRLDILVTTDTGPRHIANAFRVPAVVIMGPTNPRYTASNLERTAVLRVDLDCSPCHKKECDRDHECMSRITPGMVMDEVVELLRRARSLEVT